MSQTFRVTLFLLHFYWTFFVFVLIGISYIFPCDRLNGRSVVNDLLHRHIGAFDCSMLWLRRSCPSVPFLSPSLLLMLVLLTPKHQTDAFRRYTKRHGRFFFYSLSCKITARKLCGCFCFFKIDNAEMNIGLFWFWNICVGSVIEFLFSIHTLVLLFFPCIISSFVAFPFSPCGSRLCVSMPTPDTTASHSSASSFNRYRTGLLSFASPSLCHLLNLYSLSLPLFSPSVSSFITPPLSVFWSFGCPSAVISWWVSVSLVDRLHMARSVRSLLCAVYSLPLCNIMVLFISIPYSAFKSSLFVKRDMRRWYFFHIFLAQLFFFVYIYIFRVQIDSFIFCLWFTCWFENLTVCIQQIESHLYWRDTPAIHVLIP